MNLRDPKGYYIALGIDESADGDAIKSAYRSKAKRLHPDFNPSPIAAKQFHRLHEAYETLSDPTKRAAYDRPWRNESKNQNQSQSQTNGFGAAYARRSDNKSESKSDNKGENKSDAKRADTSNETSKPDAKAEPRTRASTAPTEQPAVCKCGKVTAQPRYIIFDLVWGRVNKVQRRGLSGIYCRSCADRTAVRASLLTWVAGWWSWPNGPKETVKALISNIHGGRKPADRNARLLMRQARAFRARGEMELARNAAEQAIPFAATPHLRHEVDSLLLSLSSYPARALKDRWEKPGWAATLQVMPLAVIVGVASMSLTLLSPTSLTAQLKEFFADWDRAAVTAPLPSRPTTVAMPPGPVTGRVYSVSAKGGNLRTGPGANYQLVAVLSQGSVVLVTETDPSGQWLRVTTSEGAAGFMAVNQLSPDVRIDALEDIGGFGKAPAKP